MELVAFAAVFLVHTVLLLGGLLSLRDELREIRKALPSLPAPLSVPAPTLAAPEGITVKLIDRNGLVIDTVDTHGWKVTPLTFIYGGRTFIRGSEERPRVWHYLERKS